MDKKSIVLWYGVGVASIAMGLYFALRHGFWLPLWSVLISVGVGCAFSWKKHLL